LPVNAVSREHVRVRKDADGFVLVDAGSRNGTIVNGRKIDSPHTLEHGDEVRVGDAILKFVESDAANFIPYALDGKAGPFRRSSKVRGLIGGYQLDTVAELIERVAPTPLSCLVYGETGTGKEAVANELHRLSARGGPMVAVNCAAIPENLVESELFGVRKGAFSGADRDRPGLVKQADGGTLFLDEIGELPLDAQAKLLRMLQEREVLAVGATTPVRVDIRLVCATHRDLRASAKQGQFRDDLFARLNEQQLRLPALRDRKEDIVQLVDYFCKKHVGKVLPCSFPFFVAVMHHDWPHNVRELESAIKRAALLARDGTLGADDLPSDVTECMQDYGTVAPPAPRAEASPRTAPTESELRDALERHAGNITALGREFNKERMQIHRWLKRYGLDPESFRPDSPGKA
jgi:DNA-binding NtrC family response regulator